MQRYGDVAYVRNVTDIDDKIMAAAADEVATAVVAERYAVAYHEDMAALNVLPPTVEPYATGHVPQMIAMILRLLAAGHAYEEAGHVLFHVPSFWYGALSRRSREEMIEGARVEVAPYKRDPADFVLWKPSSAGQPGWDSPWGRGRPGWHIECSAMVEAHLGATIDIHGGGLDLNSRTTRTKSPRARARTKGRRSPASGCTTVFSTSSARRCRSRSATSFWCAICCARRREAIRYALLAAHYRKPLDWSAAGLAGPSTRSIASI